jgi:hypothetical protein
VAIGPRTRISTSYGPTGIDGARSVDRYLRALDGPLPVDGLAFDALERDFVDDAKRFAKVRGITYDAWRDVGVSEDVLLRAGIGLEIVAGQR